MLQKISKPSFPLSDQSSQGRIASGGTLNTDLNLTGPTNRLFTNGTVGVYNTKLVGFDLGSKLSRHLDAHRRKDRQRLEYRKLTTELHMAPMV